MHDSARRPWQRGAEPVTEDMATCTASKRPVRCDVRTKAIAGLHVRYDALATERRYRLAASQDDNLTRLSNAAPVEGKVDPGDAQGPDA